jgi:hypothetical protein
VNTVTLPEAAEAEQTADYHHRVLFLTGTWGMPGSAEGPIYWHALLVHGHPADYFATELVRGCVRGREVELRGYEVEPGLSCDWYKITLDGNGESGSFGGITETYHHDWRGHIVGRYLFKNRRT